MDRNPGGRSVRRGSASTDTCSDGVPLAAPVIAATEERSIRSHPVASGDPAWAGKCSRFVLDHGHRFAHIWIGSPRGSAGSRDQSSPTRRVSWMTSSLFNSAARCSICERRPSYSVSVRAMTPGSSLGEHQRQVKALPHVHAVK